MPPLYYLNPNPNPFWNFIADLEDHPFFNGPPGQANPEHGPQRPRPNAESAWAPKRREQADAEPEMSENARGKQASAEDPPEADISTVKPEETRERDLPFHGYGRRRFAREAAREAAREGTDEEGGRRCRRGRRDRGWGGWGGRGGPPPFHPFFGPPQWHDQPDRPVPPHAPPHEHPHAHPHGPPRGPPPHHRGPHRGPSPPRRPRSDFNLGDFLSRLGEKLGVDLNGAAEGLGLTADRFTAGKTDHEVDFEPRCDIFESKELYTVHLSLPGAKKSDVGVDYDGEHSVLRITGVVHRPEADEQMLSELVVDGRKRETGVFEKAIRLGTKRDPAMIDVAGISAKMADGVLVVKIPKTRKQTEKREVPISTNSSDAEQADFEDDYSEKPVLFDAEEYRSNASKEEHEVNEKGEISLIDAEIDEKKDVQKVPEKEQKFEESKKAAGEEKTVDATSVNQSQQREQLPAYAAEVHRDEEDWENFSDASGEAEYVKINVN